MSLSSERAEIEPVVNRLLDNLSLTISSQTGRDGIILRQKIGDLRANYELYLADGTFSQKLLDCFTVSREAGAKLSSLENVHQRLFEETPTGAISVAIVQIAILFCLSAESRMITKIEFESRDDVEARMQASNLAFHTARDLAADMNDSSAYQSLTFLAGALTNHLANIARPLPRMVTFKMAIGLPALSLSNRIYYTAERWEEVVKENHIIHPAFCMKEIRGLSS